MAKGKAFKLIPQPLPTRMRSSLYREIVTEFIQSGMQSALVADTERKPATLVQGLRKVLKAQGHTDIKVVQRHSDVYLVKE